MQFVQDAQAVTAGETASYTFDVYASASFAGAVIFDLPNLTDRFTGRVFSESSTRVRPEIAVPPNASTNSGVFTLRGRHGSITHEAAFRPNVTARPVAPTTTAVATAPTIAPQFTVSATDTIRTAGPGEPDDCRHRALGDPQRNDALVRICSASSARPVRRLG